MDEEHDGFTLLGFAIEHLNAQAVNLLIKSNCDINKTFGSDRKLRWTPLGYALEKNFFKGAELLLASNADTNQVWFFNRFLCKVWSLISFWFWLKHLFRCLL